RPKPLSVRAPTGQRDREEVTSRRLVREQVVGTAVERGDAGAVEQKEIESTVLVAIEEMGRRSACGAVRWARSVVVRGGHEPVPGEVQIEPVAPTVAPEPPAAAGEIDTAAAV